MTTVVVQKWEESERGWGVRPDGYSLHLTEADRKAYVDSYWKAMPDQVPDEYSRPSGAPYTADVEEDTYNLVATSEQGVRIYDNTYPGSEGTDGWKHPATVHG